MKTEQQKRITSEEGVKNYLLAHEKSEEIFRLNEDLLLSPDCTVLVDSGAYELWSEGKGKKVDRQKYGEFCQRLKSAAKCQLRFVNADDIPGRPGRALPSRREREESARRGWENYLFLRSEMGLDVMPVFHQGESLDWLEKMAAETDYVGISPSNVRGVSTEAKWGWLEKVFGVLHLSRRTHSFGATTGELLRNFPFYSADSTTWMNGIRFGSLALRGRGVGAFGMKSVGADNMRLLAQSLHADPQLFDKTIRSYGHLGPQTMKGLAPAFQSDEYRVRSGVRETIESERNITELWAHRGLAFTGAFAESGVPAVAPATREQREASLHIREERGSANRVKEIVMRAKRSGSAREVDLSKRNILKLGEAELKVFLAYCLEATTEEQRVALDLPTLERLTGMEKHSLTSARASLKKKGWLIRLKRMPNGSYRRHPDQTKSESGGHADCHRPVIP